MTTQAEAQLAVLSSGTLASLCGKTDYEVLDDFHADLLGLYRVAYSCGHRFTTWMDFVNSEFGSYVVSKYAN